MTQFPNPVSYFEIPVTDLDRAVVFYEAVFGCTFARITSDGNTYALFPYDDDRPGASGALAQGDSYVPGQAGARLYFSVANVADTLARAVAAGGSVLYPVTPVAGFGAVAEFADAEGNVIALRGMPAADC